MKPRGKVDWDSAFPIGDREELGRAGWAHDFSEQSLPAEILLRSINVLPHIVIILMKATRDVQKVRPRS